MTRDKRAVYVFHSAVWRFPESRKLVQLVEGRWDIVIEYARRRKNQSRPQWLGFAVPEHKPEEYNPNLRKTDWQQAAYGGENDRKDDLVFHFKTKKEIQKHIDL